MSGGFGFDRHCCDGYKYLALPPRCCLNGLVDPPPVASNSGNSFFPLRASLGIFACHVLSHDSHRSPHLRGYHVICCAKSCISKIGVRQIFCRIMIIIIPFIIIIIIIIISFTLFVIFVFMFFTLIIIVFIFRLVTTFIFITIMIFTIMIFTITFHPNLLHIHHHLRFLLVLGLVFLFTSSSSSPSSPAMASLSYCNHSHNQNHPFSSSSSSVSFPSSSPSPLCRWVVLHLARPPTPAVRVIPGCTFSFRMPAGSLHRDAAAAPDSGAVKPARHMLRLEGVECPKPSVPEGVAAAIPSCQNHDVYVSAFILLCHWRLADGACIAVHDFGRGQGQSEARGQPIQGAGSERELSSRTKSLSVWLISLRGGESISLSQPPH